MALIYIFRLYLFTIVRQSLFFTIILFTFATLFTSLSVAQQVIVQPGDTLTKLAIQYNTTIETVINVNQLKSTNVHVGDKLYMSPLYEEIVVDWGDTLTDIARKSGVGVRTLLEVNDLSSTNIKIGEVLKIPKGEYAQIRQTRSTKQENKPQQIEAIQNLEIKNEAINKVKNTPSNLEQKLTERLQGDREYIVIKPGDTLTHFAKEFSISIQDLMAFNSLSSTSLNVGDVIYVSAPPPTPKELHTITVKIDDTLNDLAARYGVTSPALMRANRLATPFIRAGQILELPNNALETPLADSLLSEPRNYIVQQDDALYQIAVEFGISQERLIALNNLEGTNIYAGQELKLVEVGEEPLKPLQIAIKRGDTLANIARQYDVNLKELVSANGIELEGLLSIGQKVIIPERYVANQANSQLDQGASEIRYIAVESNDTLWNLANNHATSVEAIVADNRLNSYRINEGQILRITPGLDLPPVARSRPEVQTSSSKDSTNSSSVDTLEVNLETDLDQKITSRLIWPLKGNITSRFGYRNLVISGKSYNIHTGIDIDGDRGDPILAACSGKIVFSGWRAGYGYLVVVESLPYHYYYAHASELIASEGEQVKQGQIIAKVGATGAATGSHLHFEVRVDDKPLDPLDHLN